MRRLGSVIAFAAALAIATVINLPTANAGPAQDVVKHGSMAIGGDGRAIWKPDGTYVYVGQHGKSWTGHWKIVGDDQICVQFNDGFSRCDQILKVGSRMMFVTAWGDQYPLQ